MQCFTSGDEKNVAKSQIHGKLAQKDMYLKLVKAV